MRNRIIGGLVVVGVVVAFLVIARSPSAGQSQSRTYTGSRMADGSPNLNGIWEVLNTADWDLVTHGAQPSAALAMGAIGAEPPGMGVVEGNEIPYKPEALAKKKENAAHWLTLDPEVKCYLPGVPRATYVPHPFQIVQSAKHVLIVYQFADGNRAIPFSAKPHEDSPVDTWMGDSIAHWEGDTLVVDAKSFNDQSWFDRAGDFHSDALHVVERYTISEPNVILYEATIEDPNVFTRPWKISMPLYRHVEKNAQLMEFKCVEFVEEMMYGHLRKQTGGE